MTYSIKSFTVKDPTTIRDDMLRTIRNGLTQFGIVNPQVGFGTDYYLIATGLANEISVVNVNVQVKADAQMPDTATGTDLARLLQNNGLAYRPASPSTGAITLDCSSTTLVPTGGTLVDATGLRYQVTVGGTFSAGTRVPLISIDTGSGVNHLAGDVLKWTTAPPFCNQNQSVASGGLTGGAPAENDDTARARLFVRLQNPPGSGNWPQVNGYAEASSPLVQKAFCYPGVNGPSTCHVAVVGYATTVSKNRDIDTTSVMPGTVTPYILGQMPEYVETIITTVTNVATDVSIGLTLPSATTAQPAGPGGGWVDGSPWPAVSGLGQNSVTVTAVTSSTVFTVNAPTAPTSNVSHIAFLDPTNWTLYQAKVLSYTGGAGAYVITIDQPFPNIAAAFALDASAKPIIWPQAVNGPAYVAAFLAAMALMGPGEKTSNAGVLSRGYRHPLPVNSWPYSLNATILKSLSNVGSEVLDVSYYSRSTTTPAIPGSVANPPNILVPRFIGFYPI